MKRIMNLLRDLFPATQTITRAPSPSPLLTLPFELRSEIYEHLSLPDLLSNPFRNPLYVLLFVNRQLSAEVTDVFYRHNGTFTFLNVQRCHRFLTVTKTHLCFLRDLTVSVAYDNTFALESIFKMLFEEEDEQLSRLTIKLVSIETFSDPPPRGYMLPKQLAKLALRQANERAHRLEPLFGASLAGKQHCFAYEDSENAVKRAQESSNSFLGKMKGIRYLKVKKKPCDKSFWAKEFELAVLQLLGRMFEIAEREGAKVKRGNETGPRDRSASWNGNDEWWIEDASEDGQRLSLK